VESYDRARAVLLEAARAAAPPDIGITAWAEQSRILGHSSRLSGPYRVIRTPFWREPMDALSPASGAQTGGGDEGGAQLGASEFLLNLLGFHIGLAPSLKALAGIVRGSKLRPPNRLRGAVNDRIALEP
jgi:hypothetical protein